MNFVSASNGILLPQLALCELLFKVLVIPVKGLPSYVYFLSRLLRSTYCVGQTLTELLVHHASVEGGARALHLDPCVVEL